MNIKPIKYVVRIIIMVPMILIIWVQYRFYDFLMDNGYDISNDMLETMKEVCTYDKS